MPTLPFSESILIMFESKVVAEPPFAEPPFAAATASTSSAMSSVLALRFKAASTSVWLALRSS